MRYKLNKVYNKEIVGFSFGELPREELIELFKDGRVASKFLEKCVAKWFPEIRNVDQPHYDHIDIEGNKIEQKGFTRNGCKFVPSSMIGKNRHIDLNELAKGIKEHNLTYSIVDIVEFPSIKIKFVNGKKLLSEYSSGQINSNQRHEFFAE
tara:strand:- start:1068 stop:1520 length:453 start_codon:yes stop_codon:yes gene_type:complete